MKTLDDVLGLVDNPPARATLEDWIARRWVRPLPEGEDWRFEEIDVARVRLVCHLRDEVHVNDDGVDVVLSLLDQLHGLRAEMHRLARGAARLPDEVRARWLEAMRED